MSSPTQKRSPSDSFETEIESTDHDIRSQFFGFVKELFFRFRGKRKFTRKGVDFTHTIRVKVLFDGGGEVEVVPENMSRGGMGARVLKGHLPKIESHQRVQLKIAIDGNQWESAWGEVRFAAETKRHATIGIQFTEITADLQDRILTSFSKK